MSIQFIWNEEYSVGNTKLDAQHQRIFKLGNEIGNAPLHDAKVYLVSDRKPRVWAKSCPYARRKKI